MTRALLVVAAVLTLLALLVASRFGALARASRRKPPGLGVTNGHLAPCPNRPSCVATEGTVRPGQQMAPIGFAGAADAERARLVAILARMPGAAVTVNAPGYVAAEFRSRLFGFVDDVEFRFDDPAKRIHFRSVSRQGYSDFGVNRKRMEAITLAFVSP